MIGYLAYSLAGHDKGRTYLVIDETENYVYVVDGQMRPLDRPKKKNKRHVQVIKINSRCTDIPSITNEEIKYLIKQYCRDIKEVK
ncbi:MAG: KOW domain-containing RNA-binding protein [Lachnospiraceae bacterium]|nr:KOW domain-containing RNA-binding protein [Lachnospiraceae bacterium]